MKGAPRLKKGQRGSSQGRTLKKDRNDGNGDVTVTANLHRSTWKTGRDRTEQHKKGTSAWPCGGTPINEGVAVVNLRCNLTCGSGEAPDLPVDRVPKCDS